MIRDYNSIKDAEEAFCLDHGSNNNITNNLINNNPINFADLAHNNTFSISNNPDLITYNFYFFF
jgi:hypothetical protein